MIDIIITDKIRESFYLWKEQRRQRNTKNVEVLLQRKIGIEFRN